MLALSTMHVVADFVDQDSTCSQGVEVTSLQSVTMMVGITNDVEMSGFTE